MQLINTSFFFFMYTTCIILLFHIKRIIQYSTFCIVQFTPLRIPIIHVQFLDINLISTLWLLRWLTFDLVFYVFANTRIYRQKKIEKKSLLHSTTSPYYYFHFNNFFKHYLQNIHWFAFIVVRYSYLKRQTFIKLNSISKYLYRTRV